MNRDQATKRHILTTDDLRAALGDLRERLNDPVIVERIYRAFLTYYAVTAGLPGIVEADDVDGIRDYAEGLIYALDDVTGALWGGHTHDDADKIERLLSIQKGITRSLSADDCMPNPIARDGAVETFTYMWQVIAERWGTGTDSRDGAASERGKQ